MKVAIKVVIVLEKFRENKRTGTHSLVTGDLWSQSNDKLNLIAAFLTMYRYLFRVRIVSLWRICSTHCIPFLWHTYYVNKVWCESPRWAFLLLGQTLFQICLNKKNTYVGNARSLFCPFQSKIDPPFENPGYAPGKVYGRVNSSYL